MKNTILGLICLLFVACGETNTVTEERGINQVTDCTIEKIEIDDEPWFELTISQEIDPRSPTYVSDIAESRWINRLSWSVQSQSIGENSVTTVFHIKPLVQMDRISLRREDFVWHPRSQNFPPIEIDTHMPDVE